MIEAIMNAIKARRMDELHGIEAALLKGSPLDKSDHATMIEILGDKSGKVTKEDKLRSLFVYASCPWGVKEDQTEAGLKALIDSTQTLTPKELEWITKMCKAKGDTGKGGNLLGKVATKGFDLVSRALKGERISKPTQLAKEIIRGSYHVDGWELTAPLMNSLVEDHNLPPLGSPVIVFAVDGANWNDADSISKLAQTTKQIVLYGGNELYSSNELLQQTVEEFGTS